MSVLVVLGLVTIGACGREAIPGFPVLRASNEEVASGEWQRIAKAPAGWYRPEGAFWIGKDLVVVAGSIVESWSSKDDEWEVVAEIPQSDECEGCGYSEIAVWTGSEILLWGGGFSYRAPDGSAYSGVSVNLDGEIVPLPDAPIPVRWWHQALWTGEEMIVFGGGRDAFARRDGAAYDPSTGTWRVLPRSPVGGYANTLVWTGREVITWGGIRDSNEPTRGSPIGFIAKGAAYDPGTNSWRVLERSGLDPRGWHSAVWTGDEMIVWGGVLRPSQNCYDCGYPRDAGAYDPETRTWRTIDPGPLSGRVEHTAVWSGTHMIVYGGSPPGGGVGRNDGALYEVATDSWELLPEVPIKGRYRHAAVWNGSGMVVWGGQRPRWGGFANGAIFRPVS